jgi:hypothetical protein
MIDGVKREMYQGRELFLHRRGQSLQLRTRNAEVDLAYTNTVRDCSLEIIIFRHGKKEFARYNDWQGWPDACELHTCLRTEDKFQVEKVWRPKNDGSPPPAHLYQPMPCPG